MRVLLVFPESTFLIDPMVYPPLGLWYLASQIESQGVSVDFVDLSIDEMPDDGEFDQVWVSATSPQMHAVRTLYSNTLSKWSKTVTVLGGPAPWTNANTCSEMFDLVVRGEGDQPDVVSRILSYKTKLARGSYEIIDVGVSRTLDWVIPPKRTWDYLYHAKLHDCTSGVDHNTTTMFTSRGCPGSCAFCESGRNGTIWNRNIRYEPLDVVEKQIRTARGHGFTGLMYYDDILPLNKKRMSEIMKYHTKYDMVWRCFLRTDIIARQGGFEYLREMRNSGLVEVLAGVESADNRIKRNIHKGTTIEQDTAALQWCRELGITFKASIILGLPGETRESMERTREWILEHRPDRVDVNILVPFPGTPIVDRNEEYDVFWTNDVPEEYWFKGPREVSTPLVGTSELSPEEIQEFRDDLMQEIVAANIPY